MRNIILLLQQPVALTRSLSKDIFFPLLFWYCIYSFMFFMKASCLLLNKWKKGLSLYYVHMNLNKSIVCGSHCTQKWCLDHFHNIGGQSSMQCAELDSDCSLGQLYFKMHSSTILMHSKESEPTDEITDQSTKVEIREFFELN